MITVGFSEQYYDALWTGRRYNPNAGSTPAPPFARGGRAAGSAFCLYFMDHLPVDRRDLAAHHDFARDESVRQQVIRRGGIFAFPLATKQWSLSAAHTAENVSATAGAIDAAFEALQATESAPPAVKLAS